MPSNQDKKNLGQMMKECLDEQIEEEEILSFRTDYIGM